MRFLDADVIRYPLFAPEDGGAAAGDGAEPGKKEPADGGEGGAAADGAAGDDKGVDKSALNAGAGKDDGAGDKPGTWGDDWRDKMADGDADLAKLLSRYGSPRDAVKALRDTQTKLRTGKGKTDAPDGSDPEALKAWRKDNGIPDDATGYGIPDTVKDLVTDDDKPLLSSFTEFAHERNLPQGALDTALEWYFQSQDQILTEQAATDKLASETAIDELRQDYGREYRANSQLAKDFIASIPGVGDSWGEARMPDGRRLGDNPDFIRWAVEQGRLTFGDSAFANADAEAKHNSRKAEIEQIRNTDFERYESEGLDKEMRTILEKEEKRKR
ncbi:hypothetical protein SAMN04487974_12032 [Pelagibacterium luteolum]|uniref:Uncharacterized protein n=2 Tax=Pelagibacterium luteolum TaxID=440168 RepID=A0A1G7ZIA5_9HYPH|nr:hypothetical protein SAMN04487974_12032 [Pelagibacterium luteolum]